MSAVEGHPVGVLVGGPSVEPERIGQLARLSEELGFTELWVPEDYFFTGAIASGTLALAMTSTVPVGIGIVSAVARHPAVLAMELSTIARAFPGRAWPGIALGQPARLRQMGVHPESSILTSLRETVSTVRSLLEGNEVTVQGQDFSIDGVRLAYPPRTAVPLYMGARGPRMLGLAGEIADGTIIAWPCSPSYVTWARRHITRGMQRSGQMKHRVPRFCLFSIDVDGRKARQAIRPLLAWALAMIGRCPPTDVLGISEDLIGMIDRGGAPTIERDMPDRWLQELAIAGDPEECAAKIHEFLSAGADSVILYPYRTDLAAEMLNVFAADVLPRLGI
jgi:alkanesulfonate monooxygenase SsuD/methylene tetrahydromethanopterin reductase-like flavin-dependent oxidoreductase (luciferase family)